MVFSGIAIGFMGWGVWAHHMFVSGIGPISVAAFSLTTMFIAVPTGVKILNWMATMFRGKLRFTTAMLFAVGLVGMFTIGGLSGVTHSIAPSDTQQTDTYYIVAHFHYVLFGGALLGLFSGMYFWWPKIFGYFLDERLGKIHFWLILIGFNLTFGPMHVLGLQGMSRRVYTYDEGYGFDMWNMVATIGSFIIAVSLIVFMANCILSRRRHRANPVDVGPDPWDARSLEWMIPSPSPEHNFDEVPVVTHRDEFWHRKYGEDEDHRAVRIKATEDVAQKGDAQNVHLPSPSYWPIVLAAGLPLIGYGLIFNLWWALPGALLVAGGIYGWALEPPDDDENPHGHDHGDADHGDEPPAAAAAEPVPAAVGAGDAGAASEETSGE
jgi:cytochrome c oxidase subunit 1